MVLAPVTAVVQPLAQVLVVAVVLAVAAPVPVAPVVPIAPAAVVAQVAPAVPAESSADRSQTGTNFCCFMPVSLLYQALCAML